MSPTTLTHLKERGSALIMVMIVLAILSFLGMSLYYTIDVDYAASRAFSDVFQAAAPRLFYQGTG